MIEMENIMNIMLRTNHAIHCNELDNPKIFIISLVCVSFSPAMNRVVFVTINVKPK